MLWALRRILGRSAAVWKLLNMPPFVLVEFLSSRVCQFLHPPPLSQVPESGNKIPAIRNCGCLVPCFPVYSELVYHARLLLVSVRRWHRLFAVMLSLSPMRFCTCALYGICLLVVYHELQVTQNRPLDPFFWDKGHFSGYIGSQVCRS